MPSPQLHTHDQLWADIQAGSEHAFKQLFDLFWDDMYLYAYKIMRDKSLAQDAVQNLFIYLWEKQSQLPLVHDIKAFLFTSLKHRLLNLMRQEQTYQQHIAQFLAIVQDIDYSTTQQLQLKEANYEILSRINALPGKMKEVFYLNRVENIPVAEIAELYGTSPQTVRNQVNAALQKLKANWSLPAALMVILTHHH
ncbi:RNA polymerase sigma-70 factor (ECF subfamily) [Chitinophaga skermanii]|uniref:RNA polymerase sigma-70 factor (ECF subfamily) n=1 Tax=Chitinophaga skermanii TaxID=331697 RepID=A0A327R673_9BACT|nr:sigma-70 family RNA polymerase sigma factor [Chitinophaga skermanii]RAJ11083.1 RNA polymerase sigma-70 factor (ECF subfamily) [Chitinophaga skermanii]